jgi:hypothetical protein
MPTLDERIHAALTLPDAFAYFGDRDLGVSWGFAGIGTTNRDADPLTESNHVIAWKDLSEAFPDDVELLHSTHWMCGWVDEILVRVVEQGKPTAAFMAVVRLQERLEHYPVLDETDFSAREWDDLVLTLTNCYEVAPADAASLASFAEWGSSEDLDTETVERARGDWAHDHPKGA